MSTGVGKTALAAQAIAEHRRSAPAGSRLVEQSWIYAVPTHRLGEEVAAKFVRHGLTATVFRGRKASDPNAPGKAMCLDLEAIEAAEELGENIEQACCSGRTASGQKRHCRHYFTCAYQAQRRKRPDVWIVAHMVLQHPQTAFGEGAAVVIDESFWRSAIRPVSKGFPLPLLRSPPARHDNDMADAELADWRARLGRAIDRHEGQIGGLRREHLAAEGIDAALCTKAISGEYALKKNRVLWPGMPVEKRRAALRESSDSRQVLTRTAIWRAIRDLLEAGEGDAAGCVFLDTRDDPDWSSQVVLRLRGLSPIAKRWARLPTLLMDATLPPLSAIAPFYPSARVTAEIEAAMPHALIRSVVGSPTASRKLVKGDASGRNARDIRRYVLRRWLEHGRQRTLLICQKEAEAKLKALGLPDAIAIEHYNNVACVNRYRDVRVLILVGRTQPGPEAVEAMAGSLTAVERPRAPETANGSRWFARVTRCLRMAGQEHGIAVICDEHPDPVSEAVRQQICEAELIQALGRARGVNRTASNPVAIDILADAVLPLTVDEALAWEEVGKGLGGWIETAAEGVILVGSPADRFKLFPDVWTSLRDANREPGLPTDFSAKVLVRDLHKETGTEIPHWTLFLYRPAGRGQQGRRAWFDLSVIADPKRWLEARLGPLGAFAVAADAASTEHPIEAGEQAKAARADFGRQDVDQGR